MGDAQNPLECFVFESLASPNPQPIETESNDRPIDIGPTADSGEPWGKTGGVLDAPPDHSMASTFLFCISDISEKVIQRRLEWPLFELHST